MAEACPAIYRVLFSSKIHIKIKHAGRACFIFMYYYNYIDKIINFNCYTHVLTLVTCSTAHAPLNRKIYGGDY